MSPCLSGWIVAKKVPVHAPLPSVLSRSHSMPFSNSMRRDHRQQSDRASEYLQRESGEQRYASQSGKSHPYATSADAASGFSWAHEKYLGILPSRSLNTSCLSSSARTAPIPTAWGSRIFILKSARISSHELDYTHLRMMWRRWKKKAASRCSASRSRLSALDPLTVF